MVTLTDIKNTNNQQYTTPYTNLQPVEVTPTDMQDD